MSAERALKNITRMREMRVTGDEAQWILGACAGTVLMSVALDRLEERRASGPVAGGIDALDRLVEHYATEAAS